LWAITIATHCYEIETDSSRVNPAFNS